jgi:outer membrane scaffolding protein for murein synthesis (MipA/OmpV family)
VPIEGLTIGAGLSDVNPGYLGYHRRIDPFPLISYRSGRFFISGTSAGLIVSENDPWTISAVAIPQFMRVKASNSSELAGITTRQWTTDGGLNLSVKQPWGSASVVAVHDLLDRSNGTEIKLD